MTNDTFALSPISARSTQPGEQDYEAISEAFMETARGRWFLGEYAKRNRNADTRMVLDAVERIEQSLAAQKIPEPAPAPDTALADALSAIKSALGEARAAAGVAVDDLALNQHLGPMRKGTRVIREISWRWREIGADSRICDLIDSQVSAIEASCAQIALADPQPGLQAAFALIDRSIAAYDQTPEAEPAAITETEASLPSAEAAVAAIAEAASSVEDEAEIAHVGPAAETLSAPAMEPQEAPAQAEPARAAAPQIAAAAVEHSVASAVVEDARVEAAAPVAEPVITEPVTAEAIEAEAAAPALETSAEAVAEISPEAADAQDEALLDMVAAEMGAPDLSDESEYYDAAIAELQAAEALAAEMRAAEPIAPTAEVEPTSLAPLASTPLPTVEPVMQPFSQRAPEPPPSAPTVEPSLGSTLIANGLVVKPKPAHDPLAALRRLSQVEKIALFS